MRKTTKFDGAPWNNSTPVQKNQPMQGKKNVGITGKNMRRTGGRRGA